MAPLVHPAKMVKKVHKVMPVRLLRKKVLLGDPDPPVKQAKLDQLDPQVKMVKSDPKDFQEILEMPVSFCCLAFGSKIP